MKRMKIPAILFVLALLLLGSVPAGALDAFPPGPRETAQLGPGDGRGDTDPDDFPIIAGRNQSSFFDTLVTNAKSGGSYARMMLRTWGILPY